MSDFHRPPIRLTEHARDRCLARGITERAIKITARHGELIRTTSGQGRRGTCRVLRMTLASPKLRRAVGRQSSHRWALTVIVNDMGLVVTAYFNELHGRRSA